MDGLKMVRFNGGPLHGRCQLATEAQDQYEVPYLAATALSAALFGVSYPEEAVEHDVLVYVRRPDDHYYLKVSAPPGFEETPDGYGFEWFDAGDGVLLLGINSAPSRFGYVSQDLHLSAEFLADLGVTATGPSVLLEMAQEILDLRKRHAAEKMPPHDIRMLANMVEAGTAESQEAGTRGVVASLLRLWAKELTTAALREWAAELPL